jgi:hypothetical protein
VVVVMYGVVLLAVLVAVISAATKDARLVKESPSEIKPAGSVPIFITPQMVRPRNEGVQNNVQFE